MTLNPNLRKFALTLHITTSVGWIGAVAAFLALAVAGIVSQNALVVRAAFVGMDLTTTYVIVPLSLASLLSGIFQSLGTRWGLFRHYWVVAKLLITSLATGILLVHMRQITYLANVAADVTSVVSDVQRQGVQLVVQAGAALAALLLATVLSVYKPEGITPYGWKKQREERTTVKVAPTATESRS